MAWSFDGFTYIAIGMTYEYYFSQVLFWYILDFNESHKLSRSRWLKITYCSHVAIVLIEHNIQRID